MAVQFNCPSCAQPIEVDDTWAAQQVACPYCRKAVRAPEQSTYSPVGEIPVASPFRGAAETAEPWVAAPARRNTVAVVALVLAILSLVSLFASLAYMMPHIVAAIGDNPTPEQVEAYQRQLQNEIQSGKLPPWAVPAFMLMLASGALWIAGTVCAIIGVARPFGRGWAIGAMAALLVGPVFACFGGLAGA